MRFKLFTMHNAQFTINERFRIEYGKLCKGELCSPEKAIGNLEYVILNEVKNLEVLGEAGGEFE